GESRPDSGRLILRMMYLVSLLLWRGLPGSQAWRDAPPAHSALRQPPPPDSVRSLTSRQMSGLPRPMEQRQHCLAKLELVQAKQAVRLAIPARSAALSPVRAAAHREQISLAKSRTPLPQSRQ